MTDVSFFGWWQPPGAAAVSSATLHDGRLSAALQLTASDLDRPSDSATRTAVYDLLGPRDATGLAAAAVVHTYPVARRAERRAQQGRLRRARRAGSAVAAHGQPAAREGAAPVDRPARRHAPTRSRSPETRCACSRRCSTPIRWPASARGAHVEQEQAGRPIARLISPRALTPDRDHVAVIVPAFTTAGTPAWPTPGRRDGRARALPPLALPHEIRRRLRRARPAAEAPPGGEPRRRRCHLRPAAGGDDPGRAARSSPSRRRRRDRCRRRHGTTSRRSPSSSATPPIRSSGSPTTPGRGRLRLPFRSPGWRAALRRDYRARAVAGLGNAAAIANQELLAHEAGRLAGAYEEVADRLRRLALGSAHLEVAVAAPRDGRPRAPARRARAGASRRADGERAGRRGDGAPRPRPRAQPLLLGSATCAPAHRRGRRHPGARGRRAAAAGAERAERRPHRPVRAGDRPARRSTTRSPGGRPSTRTISATAKRLATAFDRRGLDPDTVTFLDARLKSVTDRLTANAAAPILPLLALVDSGGTRPSRERLRVLGDALNAPPDSEDLAALGTKLAKPSGATGRDGVRPRRRERRDLDGVRPDDPPAVDRRPRPRRHRRHRRLRRRRADPARRAHTRARPPRLAVPARQRVRVAAARRRHDPRRQRHRARDEPRRSSMRSCSGSTHSSSPSCASATTR